MTSTYRHAVLERVESQVRQVRAKRQQVMTLACEVPSCTQAGQIIVFPGLALQYCPVYCSKHADRVS